MQVEYDFIKDKSKLIDIRTQVEFNKESINGSLNVPKTKLLKNPEKYLNKTDEFYIICNQGEVSLSCTKILNALGYHCYSVIGGIDGLKK